MAEPAAQAPAKAATASPAPAPVPSPGMPVLAPDDMIDGIKLSEVDIDATLSLLETLTGKTIIRPAALPATTYSLQLKRAFPRSEAIQALETVLSMNGIAVVPMGEKFLKVIPLAQVGREAPEIINGSTLGMMPSGRVAAKLFQPDYLRIDDFVNQAGFLVSQGVSQPITQFQKANAALITDTISNLQRLETLLLRLDKPAPMPKFYTLKFAKASELVQKIQGILQNQILLNQLGSLPTYTPDDRTNQVILVADSQQQAFFDELISRLDIKADPNTKTEVLYLKNAMSKDVAALLTQIISGQNSASQKSGGSTQLQRVEAQPVNGQPATGPATAQTTLRTALQSATAIAASTTFSSIVTVIADERSNAVVVNGTQDDLHLIKELVDKIDIILAQVRVEVIIAEVSLTDNEATGIDALGLQVTNNKLTGVSGSGTGFSLGGTAGSGVATLSGKSLTGLIGLNSGDATKKKRANILSTPTITTSHNKEAEIFVGTAVPTISSYLSDSTSSSTSSGYRTSVSSQQIGIKLHIKPLIGADGTVQLEITQDVDSILEYTTIDSNTQPVISKRNMKSYITVNSGDVIVLGGLQQIDNSNSRKRLGPIPIIGDLFGPRSSTKTRNDLIFFLRPVVLTNTKADNAEAMVRLEQFSNKEAVKETLNPATIMPKEEPVTPTAKMKRK